MNGTNYGERVEIRPVSFDSIIAHENGDLSHVEDVRFLAGLAANGQAWKLQGHYGRLAANLIKRGVVYATRDGVTYIDWEAARKEWPGSEWPDNPSGEG